MNIIGRVMFVLIFLSFTLIPIESQVIVKSQTQLTLEEYLQLSEFDPELGGYKLFETPDPTVFEKYVERDFQSIILVPVVVKEGPQFVVPGEFFLLKVTIQNVDNMPYQIAILRRPDPGFISSVIDSVKSAFSSLYNRLLGRVPEQQIRNETWEIVPVYYLIAALDPELIIPEGQRQQTLVYPGSLVETEPGYGCYDIVLMNEEQAIQVVRHLENGTITIDDLMCGRIRVLKLGPFSVATAESLAGPITVALPFVVTKQIDINVVGDRPVRALGTATVAVQDGRVVAIYQGCTDKGDGEPYIKELTLGGQKYEIIVNPLPGDCILNPGETMEFYVYGFVNPLPSGTIPRENVGQVLVDLYTNPELAKEYVERYPGAIHEVVFMLGRINDIQVGITFDDIKRTIGSISLIGAGAAAGFFAGGPLGAGAGLLAGLIANYLFTGSFISLPAFDKAFECVYEGKCLYEVTSVKTFKTFLVISDLQVQTTIELIHLGILAIISAIAGAAGYIVARRA